MLFKKKPLSAAPCRGQWLLLKKHIKSIALAVESEHQRSKHSVFGALMFTFHSQCNEFDMLFKKKPLSVAPCRGQWLLLKKHIKSIALAVESEHQRFKHSVFGALMCTFHSQCNEFD